MLHTGFCVRDRSWTSRTSRPQFRPHLGSMSFNETWSSDPFGANEDDLWGEKVQ